MHRHTAARLAAGCLLAFPDAHPAAGGREESPDPPAPRYTLTELTGPPGLPTVAPGALGDDGRVVGAVTGHTRHNSRACLWSGGTRRLLPVPPGTRSSGAYALHPGGNISGYVYDSARRGRPVVWRDADSAPVVLSRPLRPERPEHKTALVGGRRETVGHFGHVAGARSEEARAGMWRGGLRYDLNDCATMPHGWVLRSAHHINSCGQILAQAERPGDLRRRRQFLLTPVSAPAPRGTP